MLPPPRMLEAFYPIQGRRTKPRSNLPRSGNGYERTSYLVMVNWATLIRPLRKRSAHPVR
ncbi:Uncharacterised protein [Mycobacterium tuberculosis]|nr:Uncharacterised protein [Mycobacterium tuberculosis]